MAAVCKKTKITVKYNLVKLWDAKLNETVYGKEGNVNPKPFREIPLTEEVMIKQYTQQREQEKVYIGVKCEWLQIPGKQTLFPPNVEF